MATAHSHEKAPETRIGYFGAFFAEVFGGRRRQSEKFDLILQQITPNRNKDGMA